MHTVADAEGAGSGVARLPERRRAGPRVALTARIEIETRGAGPPIPGSTLDIGLGGLCAQIEQPIELPEVTGVRIMHGRQDLTLVARGCWVRPAQFGSFAWSSGLSLYPS